MKNVIKKLLHLSIKVFKVKDVDNYLDNVFTVLSRIGTLITFAIIFTLAYVLNQIPATIVLLIALKFTKQGHFAKWTECCIATVFVLLFFMVFRNISENIVYDIIVGIGIVALFSIKDKEKEG